MPLSHSTVVYDLPGSDAARFWDKVDTYDADLSCMGGPTCPHRACVNPGHLILQTHEQNCQSGERGRQKATCRKGMHPMEGANLLVLSRGTRECRACKRQRQRDRQRVQPVDYRT